MSVSVVRRITAIIVILSLIWAAILGINVLPMLRGDYGWRWPYAFPPDHPERLALLALIVAIYLLIAWLLFRQPRRTLILAWSIIGTIALTIAVLFVSTDRPRYELYTRTISGLTTGWHYAAADFDDRGGVLPVLRAWPEFMHSFVGIGSHVTVSPPGLPLIYYTAGTALDASGASTQLANPLRADQCHNFRIASYTDGELASAWLGILMPLWAALAAIPIYYVGRRFYSEQAGLLAALWWPLIPSMLMFAPHPSTAYPLFTVAAIGFLALGMDRRQPLWMVLSGFVVSALIFVNLTSLPLVFMAGILTLIWYWLNRASLRWSWPFEVGGWFALGLISVWLLYWLISSQTPIDILNAVMQEHLSLDRPYFPWLFLHLNDFGTFIGWPLTLLGAVASVHAFRSIRAHSDDARGVAITLAAAITLIVLDLSGINRGESGRIWLFLAPFLLLGAAELLQRIDPTRSTYLITAGQAAILVAVVAFIHVIDSGLTDPPSPPAPPIEAAPAPLIPSQAVFGDTLILTDVAGRIETRGDDHFLILWLNWSSSGQVDRPYYYAVIPVASDGTAQQAALIQPFAEQYPTTCWLPSSGLLQDRIEVPITASDASGDWWVSLALIDGETSQPLPVHLPDGAQDQQTGIGPFRISADE